MKRPASLSTIGVLLLLTIILSVGASLTTAQTAGIPPRTATHSQTGKLTFIGTNPVNAVRLPQATAAGLATADRASAILAVYAPQFGVASPAQDLRFIREFGPDKSSVSRRYQQTYQGIPIFGGELVLNMTPDGGLISMMGEVSPDLAISIRPKLSVQQAQAAAIQKTAKDFQVSETTLTASTPELWIYDERLLTPSDEAAALVWRVEVSSNAGAPIKTLVLIDAKKGYINLIYNQIDDRWKIESSQAAGSAQLALPSLNTTQAQEIVQRVPGVADLATYTANHTTTLPGSFLCDESNMACTSGANPDADAAHLFAKGTYDMYWTWHGRDSLNGAGLQLKSSTQLDVNYCNAYWDGSQMAYGDGCIGSIVRDDVVGHELTHGVTEFTSNLVYAYQSGAMNKSFSDVWGEFFDLTNNSGDETPANRWRIGEEIDFGEPQMGLRDMEDPTLFNNADRMLSPLYYTGSGDSGGVHFNSGVNNKAAYLMVDGATFNGYTITGIGITKAAAIYYNVQTTKLTSASDYFDLRNTLNQACVELTGGAAGITASDCDQVNKATLATEMDKETGVAAAASAAICPADSPIYLFNDGLENGSANWVSGATSGANAWTLASTKNPLVGARSNSGNDLATVSGSFVAMNSSITLPANAYLHFTHRFSFEYNGGSYYDGGIIEYSTDAGANWTQLPSAGFYQAGQNYGGTLSNAYGNPLGGKSAFVARSGSGYASSRYTLASLAGQNVRFRWVIGSDNIVAARGWRIDDVKIYTCGVVPTNTPTPSNTDVPPTATNTDVPATATATSTDVPPTATNTEIPATATDTNTPGGPTETATETNTPGGPTETATETSTPGGPTETATATPTDTGMVDLLLNGSFEDDTDLNKIPDGWTGKNLTGDKQKCNKPGKVIAYDGDCLFHFKSATGEKSKLSQNVDIAGLVSGDTLTLGGFANASGTVNSKIKVVIAYVDTSLPKSKITVKLTTATGGWAALSGTLEAVLADDPAGIKIILQNKGTSGKIRYDGMTLEVNAGGSGLLPLP